MPGFDLSLPPAYFVETEYEARQWMNHFLQTYRINDGLGLDSETSGTQKNKDVVLIWSLSDGANRVCLPAQFIPLFREPILENPEIPFDLTNAKFDAHMFANSGADISKAGPWRDTIVQSFLFNENNQGRHGLKECVREHLGRDAPTFEQTFGKLPAKKKGVPPKTYGDLIKEALADAQRRNIAADYAAMDAFNSTVLRNYFDQQLDRMVMYSGMTLKRFFYEMEVPFTKVLWRMERRGFQIDAAYLAALQGPMGQRLSEIEKEFAKEAAQIVNLNSTNSMRWFFFEHLKKPVVKMTDGGTKGTPQPSIDYEVLEQWAGQGDPWAKLMIEHRSISKIKGTYVDSLMELIDHEYRVHTSLNQIGAQSGRLSSSDPNLQNIPRPGEDQFRIRDAFIASKDRRLIVADYAQLELRIMAHFSQDPRMIQCIIDGIDLHCFAASEMHGIPYDEIIAAVKHEKAVKKAQSKGEQYEPLTEREEQLIQLRQDAKACGFGIIYGIGGPRLAAQLTQSGDKYYSEAEGWQLISKWFQVFPMVRVFIESMKKQMRQIGYVQTITGRFRRAGDIANMKKGDASQVERTLVNAIIQGTAADIAKAAMLKCEYDPFLNQHGVRMLLQVHDELIFEVPDEPEIVKACKQRIKEIMEDPFGAPLRVPLPAEVGDGYTWAGAK